MKNLSFQPFPTLHTERLDLVKPDRDAHAAELFKLRSNPEVMRFIPRSLAVTIADAVKLLDAMLDGIEKNESINWAILFKNTNKLLGCIGFVRMSKVDYRAEIGYSLSLDVHRQGIMNEAIKPVIRYGFEEMGLHSIEAVIDPENHASENLLLRNEFIKEAHFKENYFHDGKFLDSVHYSRLTKT